MDASIEQLTAPLTNLVQKTRMAGLTSGSTQSGVAKDSSGAITYQVQTTVGSYMSDMEQTTDDKSYKIFSSVQGSLVEQ